MSLLLLFGLLLIGVIVYMTLWFEAAIYLKRIDLVDSAWGLGFVYVGLLTFFLNSAPYPALHRLALILVGVWGLRLFVHISKRNLHKAEDHRYAVYRQKWGADFQRKAYVNIYLLQGLLILIVSTPVIAILNTPNHSWGALNVIGFVVWLFGIVFETIADRQLQSFLQKRKANAIMQSGLWRYSRHPNYFGEISTWVGAGLVAVSLGQWWGLLGPVVIAYLIIKVSGLPPLEKHYKDNKDYQKYAQHTSAIVPLPPK